MKLWIAFVMGLSCLVAPSISKPNSGNSDNQSYGYSNGQASSYSNGQGSSYSNGQGSSYSNEQGSSYSNGQGSSYSNGQASSYSNGQGSSYSNGQASASYSNGQGSSYSNGQGSSYSNGQASSYSNGQGSSYSNGQGSSYSNGQASSYSNEQGSSYSGSGTYSLANGKSAFVGSVRIGSVTGVNNVATDSINVRNNGYGAGATRYKTNQQQRYVINGDLENGGVFNNNRQKRAASPGDQNVGAINGDYHEPCATYHHLYNNNKLVKNGGISSSNRAKRSPGGNQVIGKINGAKHLIVGTQFSQTYGHNGHVYAGPVGNGGHYNNNRGKRSPGGVNHVIGEISGAKHVVGMQHSTYSKNGHPYTEPKDFTWGVYSNARTKRSPGGNQVIGKIDGKYHKIVGTQHSHHYNHNGHVYNGPVNHGGTYNNNGRRKRLASPDDFLLQGQSAISLDDLIWLKRNRPEAIGLSRSGDRVQSSHSDENIELNDS